MDAHSWDGGNRDPPQPLSESRVQPTKNVGMGETKAYLGILVSEVLQFSLSDLL